MGGVLETMSHVLTVKGNNVFKGILTNFTLFFQVKLGSSTKESQLKEVKIDKHDKIWLTKTSCTSVQNLALMKSFSTFSG